VPGRSQDLCNQTPGGKRPQGMAHLRAAYPVVVFKNHEGQPEADQRYMRASCIEAMFKIIALHVQIAYDASNLICEAVCNPQQSLCFCERLSGRNENYTGDASRLQFW
jgi:DsbC/DsbD-like thiol-disulfide interchange protein